jgi:hypothetical protein
MKSFTATDLDTLAHGRPIDSDLFLAVFANADAVGELARLLQVHDLLVTPATEPVRPATVAEMDVSWDELAAYGERGPLPPGRRAGVERFLGTHFPEALRDPAETDTVECRADQDTEFPLRPGAKPVPPAHRPPGTESKQC